MKQTILALAIASISFASQAGAPTDKPPIGPIDVNVANTPLPTWLAQPPSLSGGSEQQTFGEVCWAESGDNNDFGCTKPLDFVGKIWAIKIDATTDGVDNNCVVRALVTKDGLTQYALGSLVAGPGLSSQFIAYPVLVEIAEQGLDLLIYSYRIDNTKYCRANVVLNVVP